MTTIGWTTIRGYLTEHGRTTTGGDVVAPCSLCGEEAIADRLTTTMHAGALAVVCRRCASHTEFNRRRSSAAPKPRRTP